MNLYNSAHNMQYNFQAENHFPRPSLVRDKKGVASARLARVCGVGLLLKISFSR
jgi:hypothetical protein